MKMRIRDLSSTTSGAGFTLTELMVVMGTLAILFGLINISLVGFYRRPVQRGAADVLVADIRSQQLKAMTGDSNGGANTAYGIHFSASSYTLFKGASYSANDPSNFVVNLGEGVTLTGVTFPSYNIVFQKGTGEVAGWVLGSDRVTITDIQAGLTTTIKINRYGATY